MGRLGAHPADPRDRRSGRHYRLLVMPGSAPGSAAGFGFDIRHRKSFPRIAVLGNRPWHKWLTLAAKPVFIAEMRYFEAAREAEALEWVSGN
jgi:hypothetical protein